jgi:hypothetical protein
MRAHVCPLSSLRMMLWPIVPTTIVKSFMAPSLTLTVFDYLNGLNVLNDWNFFGNSIFLPGTLNDSLIRQ